MLRPRRQMFLLSLGLQLAVSVLEILALPPGFNTRYDETTTELTVRWQQQSTSAAFFDAEQPVANQPTGDEASRTNLLSDTQRSQHFKTNNSSYESELKISQQHRNANASIKKLNTGLGPVRNRHAGDFNTGTSPPALEEYSRSTAKSSVAVVLVIGIVVLVGLMHFKAYSEIRQRCSSCAHFKKHESLSRSKDNDEPSFGVPANSRYEERADWVLNVRPTPPRWVESFRLRTLFVIRKLVNGIRGSTVVGHSWELVQVLQPDVGREMQL